MKNLLFITTLFSLPSLATLPIQQVLVNIEKQSNGVLNKDSSVLDQEVLAPLTHQTITNYGSPLLMNQLQFDFDSQKNIYSPTVISDPEQIQSLFQFNEEKFVRDQLANDFLDAKWKYYRSLKYNIKLKSYLYPTPRLSDWMALNHPPIKKLSRELSFYSKKMSQDKTKTSVRNSVSFQKNIDQLSGNELTSGNKIKFLNNKEVSESRIELVKSAKKTLWGSSLLMVCDAGTKPLIDLLALKVKQGIEVRIILDHFMQSMQKGHCSKTLERLGIKVLLVKGMISHLSAFHMKMWIADLELAQIEGMNMIDVQTLSTGFNHLYRDSGLTFQGPIVTETYEKYIELWNHYSDEQIPIHHVESLTQKKAEEKSKHHRGAENYQKWLTQDSPESLCRLITQDRKTVKDQISPVYLEYLKSANHQIIATSVRRGYGGVARERGWHNKLLTELVRKAANDHVQVDLMVNTDKNAFSAFDTPNSGMDVASRKNLVTSLMRKQRNFSIIKSIKTGVNFFEEIAEETANFRTWSYMDFSHLKVSLIDQDTFISGSYNLFTPRSNKDAELIVICQDQQLAKQASEQLTLDMSNSTPFPFHSQLTQETSGANK